MSEAPTDSFGKERVGMRKLSFGCFAGWCGVEAPSVSVSPAEDIHDGVEALGMHVPALLVCRELLLVHQDGVKLAIRAGLGEQPTAGYIGGVGSQSDRGFPVERSEVSVLLSFGRPREDERMR